LKPGGIVDHHLVRRRELRRAPDDLDAAALEEDADAAGHLLHDLVLALEERAPVDLRLADVDAEFLRAPDLLVEVRGDDPCLGRDAAPVEARAAQLLLLDDGGLEAELRGADRGNVAARAGAHDDELKVLAIGHGGTRVSCGRTRGASRTRTKEWNARRLERRAEGVNAKAGTTHRVRRARVIAERV
jgi:hypothetical protein